MARESYGRLLAWLVARGRDIAAAEDALADAFAAALATWPRDGVPERAEAWLLTAARRRLTDAARRRHTSGAAIPDLLRLSEEAMHPADPDRIPDHRLALMLACAGPEVAPAARAALMLQCVLGLGAARIAAAFLVSPAAMGQRLVRAKRRIAASGARFELPGRAELAARLPSVLEAIYAAYATGTGDPADGGALAGEALWLARICAGLAPDQPEALGLAALLLHVEARRSAGRDDLGRYVPLAAQDPSEWDAPMQAEAEALLRQAAALGAPGRFQWEAAIASAHAARRLTGRTDWDAILLLYDALLDATASPVVAVNRAVALAEVKGAASGLAALAAAAADARLAEYQPYWAALAALAERAGEAGTASQARRRAAALATDPAARDWLLSGGPAHSPRS